MNIDIDKVVKAVEADAGQVVPGLRESLIEMKSGQFAEVHKPEQILVRAARNKLGLSQPKFAELIDTPVATVRDWEQGRFAPPGGMQCLLRIALAHPEIVKNLAV